MMDPTQDLIEAEELLAETQRLRYRNNLSARGINFTPADHNGNRALRRQAAKNQKRKSR